MFKIVGKLWESMGENWWESCEKVSTFLTKAIYRCEMLWEMFGFTRSFGGIYTCVSTENLFGFTVVRRADLHIYT